MNQTGTPVIENDALLSEDYFQKMLIHERKRTERFGRPFMLIMLDVGRLVEKRREANDILFQNLALAVNSSTREIDLKGWYMRDKLIGILCPEFSRADKNWILEKLGQKLAAYLEPDEAAAIKIFCLFYPDIEEKNARGAKDIDIDELHPEWRGFFQS
ncbi:MAG TPA: hypothetical protein VLX68_14615 [Chitinivibrionales bacterium]|nr:hypothetical protein [Chitinivibrionales bacterium]